jgi:hypothetical protein
MIQIEKDYITATSVATVENVLCIVVDCTDFDHYKSLPAVVSHDGRLCGKTGWNSDTGRAYYQSNAMIVKIA